MKKNKILITLMFGLGLIISALWMYDLSKDSYNNVAQIHSDAVKVYKNSKASEEELKKACDSFKKAAQESSSISQNFLGTCYEKGRGREKNIDTAIYWYKKSANQNYALAQLNLGVIAYRNNRYLKAFKWFNMAAKSNNAEAQSFLANMYAKGQGVDLDLQKSLYWYSKAADGGDPSAQFNYGQHFKKEGDFSKAHYWFDKAAQQNLPDALYVLGVLYEKGTGVRQDYLQAGLYFRKAANHNNKSAKKYLKEIAQYCYDNNSLSQDAVDACLISAGSGDKNAMKKLVLYYHKGIGVAKSNINAYAWAFSFLTSQNKENLKTSDVKSIAAASILILDELDENSKIEAKEKAKEYVKKYVKF